METLRQHYLAALPGRIDALESARAEIEDAEARATLRRIAHSLKGSGASYGFPRVSDAAAAAETAPDAGLAEQVDALLHVLRELAAEGEGRATSILVIDDDPEIQNLARVVLAAADRRIETVGAITAAESVLRDRTPDLIVLDLLLPDGDGRTLLMRLRDRIETVATPILVLSASGGGRARAECLSLGADRVIEKPFDPGVLAEAVASELERRASDRARVDAVTGLPDRSELAAAYERVPERRVPVAFALIDPDDVAGLNRSLGRGDADAVLRRFAAIVRDELPDAEAVVRWSREALAALWKGSASAQAEAQLDGLVRRLRAEPWDRRLSAPLTASAALVQAEQRPPLDEIKTQAEHLLHHAKTGGRDRLVTAMAATDRGPGELRVLLAEDDELTASLIVHRLGREGVEVVHRTEGDQALEAAREGGYALAILDVKMPGMDGFDLLESLRRLDAFRDTPIIMLTAMGSEHDVVRGFELGADDYVLKPFSPVELVARVQRHLRRS